MVLKHIVFCALLLGTSVLLSTAAPITDAIVPETELAGFNAASYGTQEDASEADAARIAGTAAAFALKDPALVNVAATPAPTSTPATEDDADAPAPPTPEVKVHFEHILNDTPPPASDVPVAPGAAQLAYGVDRYDGNTGAQNVFQWSYDRYLSSRYKFDGGKVDGTLANKNIKGHEGEIIVDDGEAPVSYMVPDQLTMNRNAVCESGSHSKTEVITSSAEMEKSEAKSRELAAEGTVPVGGVPVEVGMQYGSSKEAREYEASKNAGEDVSIFASVTSLAYGAQLNGYEGATAQPLSENDLSDAFKGAVTMLGAEPTDDQLRAFTVTFGTDFITHAMLGGKVTQQTSMKSSDYSADKSNSLQQEASASLNVAFVSVGADKSSSTDKSSTTSTSSSKEVHTAKFNGGIPSEDYYEWCASTTLHPVPVQYRTKPISDLIRDIWPDSTRQNVANMVETYVSVTRKNEIGGCKDGTIYNKVTGKCDEATCPAGTQGFKEDGVEQKCQECAAGSFSLGKENLCMECSAGTYSDKRASECLPCPAHQTSDPGSSSCAYIKSGKYKISCKNCGITDGTTRYLTETDAGKKGNKKNLDESKERWSYWSTSTTKELWITHVSLNLYRISNTAETRSLVVESGGEKNKGDATFWAKFTPDRSDDFTITCDTWPKTDECRLSFGSFAAVESPHGNKDIPSGGKWIAFRYKDWVGTLELTPV